MTRGRALLRQWMAEPWRSPSYRILDLPLSTLLGDAPATTPTFSKHTRDILKRAGLDDIRILRQSTLRRLQKIRGMGLKNLRRLLAAFDPMESTTQEGPPGHAPDSAVAVSSIDGARSSPEIERDWKDAVAWFRKGNLGLPNWLLDVRFPPQGRVPLQKLPLKRRTIRAMQMSSLGSQSELRTDLSIGGLLRIPGFGAVCVADLVLAWEQSPHPALPARNGTLEVELTALAAAAGFSAQRNQIAARVLGWDGMGGTTSAQAGRESRLTRERTRQIVAEVCENIKRVDLPTPRLDAAITVIGQSVGKPAEQAEALLLHRGIVGKPFPIEKIAQAAELLARPLSFRLAHLGGNRMLLPSNWDVSVPARIRGLAQRLLRRHGAGRIDDLELQVQSDPFLPKAPLLTRELLQMFPGFVWLDKEEGWFWLATSADTIVPTVIRRVLAIVPKVTVRELHQAIYRATRRRYPIAPLPILRQLCRHLPWCRVEGSCVRPAEPVDPHSLFSESELACIDVLRSASRPLSLAEVVSLSGGRISQNPIAVLHHSAAAAVVIKPAPGRFSLLGSPVTGAGGQGT